MAALLRWAPRPEGDPRGELAYSQQPPPTRVGVDCPQIPTLSCFMVRAISQAKLTWTWWPQKRENATFTLAGQLGRMGLTLGTG